MLRCLFLVWLSLGMVAPAVAQVASTTPPMAVFDAKYRAQNKDKTRVSVPEVYELVNVAISLTAIADASDTLVAKDNSYYRDVQTYFAPVKNHPFVAMLDREIRGKYDRYFDLKKNAYAFEYGERNRIVRSRVYDRTGFSKDPVNHLLPYMPLMQDFSEKSGFRSFYKKQQPLYRSQIAYLEREVGLQEMMSWLRANFPGVKTYDTVNIVFSPLVSGSQSATWMESNGFSELQPHVNFPYARPADSEFSDRAAAFRRGFIIFTELNHGFINPLADRYEAQLEKSFRNSRYWSEAGKTAAGYGTTYAFFNEMMNWGLASLYVAEKAPPAERAKLLEWLNTYMKERRGFIRYPEFSAFIIDLHSRRNKSESIASLYPQIIAWYVAENEKAGAPPTSPAS